MGLQPVDIADFVIRTLDVFVVNKERRVIPVVTAELIAALVVGTVERKKIKCR